MQLNLCSKSRTNLLHRYQSSACELLSFLGKSELLRANTLSSAVKSTGRRRPSYAKGATIWVAGNVSLAIVTWTTVFWPWKQFILLYEYMSQSSNRTEITKVFAALSCPTMRARKDLHATCETSSNRSRFKDTVLSGNWGVARWDAMLHDSTGRLVKQWRYL